MASDAPISLRVGASKTIGEFVIAPKVERFLRNHPEASFSLMVDNTQVLLRALEAGRLDFALVEGFFERSRYETRLCRQEAFFGVCSPGHRLAGRTVAMEELDGLSQVFADLPAYRTPEEVRDWVRGLLASGSFATVMRTEGAKG